MSGFNPTFKTAVTFEDPALSNTAVDISTNGVMILGVQAYNPNAVVAYIQIFNMIEDLVILGLTTPVKTIPIPASGYAAIDFPYGLELPEKGLCFAATTEPRNAVALTNPIFASIDYSN
jgi:hypothetical protein